MRTVAPRFPSPPKEWGIPFMQEYTRAMLAWIAEVTAQSHQEVGETAFTTVTASYVVRLSDGIILVDTTAGNVAITIPDASTVLGREFTVKRKTAGVNTLTITATSGNIDGSANATIPFQFNSVTLKSDGTNFWIV